MKNEYTKAFELFWKAYPRKSGKLPAFKAWQKQKIDDDGFLPAQIVQDVEKRTRFNFWPDDITKIPHAATFLNQARWQDEWMDEVKTPATRKAEHRNAVTHFSEPLVDLDHWQIVANRVGLQWMLNVKGTKDELVNKFIKIKNETVEELRTACEEEAVNDKREAAIMLAEMLLSRWDRAFSKSGKATVMRGVKR